MIVKIPLYFSFNVDEEEYPNFRDAMPIIVEAITENLINLNLVNEDGGNFTFITDARKGLCFMVGLEDFGNFILTDTKLLNERKYLELIRCIEY